MTTLRLDEATPAWLDAHLAQYGGLAAHVPRTPIEARSRYLSSALGLSLDEPPDIGSRSIVLRTATALGGETLRALTGIVIAHNGATYAFDEIRPSLAERAEPEPRFEICFSVA